MQAHAPPDAMLIEPTQIRPSARRSRAWRLLTLAAAPAVLVGVVMTGTLGRDRAAPSRPDATTGVAASAQVGSSAGIARAAASAPAPASTEPIAGSILALVGLPSTALGLSVLPVDDALALRTASDPRVRGLLAVGGYLTLTTADPACRADGPDALVYCGRVGVIGPVAVSTAERTTEGDAADLRLIGVRVDLPPAVGAPDALAGPAVTLPVIAFGRFHDEVTPCPWGASGCSVSFRVDRIAWAAGRWLPVVAEIDPALSPSALASRTATRRLAVGHAIPGSGPLLEEAAMRPSTLERIMPEVIPALRGTGPVWVIRTMLRPDRHEIPGLAGQWTVATSVIEDDTGEVVYTALGA